jgi:hypothetical protein
MVNLGQQQPSVLQVHPPHSVVLDYWLLSTSALAVAGKQGHCLFGWWPVTLTAKAFLNRIMAELGGNCQRHNTFTNE